MLKMAFRPPPKSSAPFRPKRDAAKLSELTRKTEPLVLTLSTEASTKPYKVTED